MKYSFFYQKSTVKRLSIFGIICLVLVVIAEFFIELHGHFSLISWFSFNAVYGFLSCVLLLVVAKLLGLIVKKREDYYDL